MTTTLTALEALTGRVTGADIETLTGLLNESYDKVNDSDPDGDEYTVVDYLTEPAEQFVASRAIHGGALSHNTATALALLGAVKTLEAFYDAELRPVFRRGYQLATI